MDWLSVPEWLLSWPQFTAMLSGYLVRLGKLPPEEVEKSWLCRACRTAKERTEARQHLDVLEEAASLCNESARSVLTKKFEGTLPRSPAGWNRDDDDRLLDVVVELAAYRWLRREYPIGDLEYVAAAKSRSPDLRVRKADNPVGVECKNVHMSKDIRDAFDASQMVSGSVSLSVAFIRKVQEKLDDAMQQLADYGRKIVFMNLRLDPDLWPIESEVGDTLRDMIPAGCQLVVFSNYAWAEPKWVFQG